MSVNKVILLGNVGQDPEIRHLENGTPVAKFTLATSESYKNKAGEKITNTEWHTVIAWRGLAEIVEKYVKKGQQLYIEGRIRSRKYEDANKVMKTITEIQAESLQMLGSKAPAKEEETQNISENIPVSDSMPSGSDDLPF